MVTNFTRCIFLQFEKIFRTIRQGHRFCEISYFPFLTSLVSANKMFRNSCLQLFFKIGFLKNFTILTGKHFWCRVFFIKYTAFRAATLSKGDSDTGVFLRTLQSNFRTAFYIEQLRWLILNSRRVCLLAISFA